MADSLAKPSGSSRQTSGIKKWIHGVNVVAPEKIKFTVLNVRAESKQQIINEHCKWRSTSGKGRSSLK
jgi:hypothetical protein